MKVNIRLMCIFLRFLMKYTTVSKNAGENVAFIENFDTFAMCNRPTCFTEEMAEWLSEVAEWFSKVEGWGIGGNFSRGIYIFHSKSHIDGQKHETE